MEIGGVKNLSVGPGRAVSQREPAFYLRDPGGKAGKPGLKLPELDFEISNLQVYTMDAGCLGDEDIAVPEMEEELDRAGGEVFAGELQMAEDGYLATSSAVAGRL